MSHISETVEQLIKNVNNNDNSINRKINVSNDNDKYRDKYALDTTKFHPNNESSYTAVDIANQLNDTDNFAFYYHVVNTIGSRKARKLLSHLKIQDEVNKRKNKPIKNPKKYFTWLFKNRERIGL